MNLKEVITQVESAATLRKKWLQIVFKKRRTHFEGYRELKGAAKLIELLKREDKFNKMLVKAVPFPDLTTRGTTRKREYRRKDVKAGNN